MMGSLGSQLNTLGTAMELVSGEGGALARFGSRLGNLGVLATTFGVAFTATTAILDAFNIKNKIGTALYDAVDAIQGVWGGDDQSKLIDQVSYGPTHAGDDTATLDVNTLLGLPAGSYRLLVCGNAVVDESGNFLDGDQNGVAGDRLVQ